MLRHLIKGLSLAMGLFGLTACATVSVSPEQLQLINSGSQSGVIMSFRQHEDMVMAKVSIANVKTEETYLLSMYGTENIANDGPGMVMVLPGQYRVVDGEFSNASMTANMPLLRWWFRDFTVGPGEVVDLGTLKVTDVDVRSITSDQLAAFINTLTSGDAREKTIYVMYAIDYSEDAWVQSMLKSKYPSLTVTPVKRPLQVALDRKEFEQLIVEAYAPGPDGKSPTSEDARAKVSALLKAFVLKSRVAPAS